MNALQLPTISLSMWRDLWSLTKPKVVQLIVFCAAIGMLLSLEGWPDLTQWRTIALASLGIWMLASSAAVINCLLEREIDARMRRTAWRPTARTAVTHLQAATFAVLLGATGSIILWMYVNALTMWLTLAALIGYAGIYTVILKPMTPQNIVIGGAAGAMPPVLGWCAMQGSIGVEPLILFLIIFVWTPPHFWALALYRVDDYRRSGLPMLPVTHGMAHTARQVFLYTLALLTVSVAPSILGFRSWFYLLVACTAGVIFCLYGYRLMKNYSDELARKTFRWSLWHLTAIFAAMLVDHYWM